MVEVKNGGLTYFLRTAHFNTRSNAVNRYLLPLFGFLTVASIALVTLALASDDESPRGIAGLENGPGRQAWELMRLRDPATGRIPDGVRAEELAFAATLPTRDQMPLLAKGSALPYGWVQRGPSNIGGRTRAFALDVTGEDTILAGGVSSGMFRSSDGGITWTRTTLPTQFPSVSALAQDTRAGKTATWYMGTGELLGASASGGGAYYYGDGMFKSSDNGRTWTPIASMASGTPHLFDKVSDFVWRVAVDVSRGDSDIVYAALYGTIVRTANGGTTWRNVLGGQPQTGNYNYYTDVAVTPTGVVYATMSSDGWRRGIWRSDNGITWNQITPPDMPDVYKRIVMGVTPQNPNVVYFLGETPGTGTLGRNFRGDSSWQHLWRYTYLSGDGSGDGGRWEDLSASLPLFGPPHGDFFTQGSYDMLVEVDPFDSNHVVIGGTNIYSSRDGFRSASAKWIGGYQNTTFDSTVVVELEYPNHHPDQHRAIFSPTRPNVLYTGSDGGVHRTDDPHADSVSWTSLNRGYLTTQFYTVAIDHGTPGDNTVVGGMQDNGTFLTRVTDALRPWERVGTGDGSWAAFADGGSSLYVSKQLGKTYRVILDAAGKTVASTRVDPLGVREYLFINPFVLDPTDQRIMYLAGGHQIWRNSDLTAIPLASTQPATVNWTALAATELSDSIFITALGASKEAPAHRLYYGTSTGQVFRIDDASTGEPTVRSITTTNLPRNAYVSCIAVDPLDADHAIVVFSNYRVQSLFITNDGGTTWQAIGGNLEGSTSGTGAGPSCRWASILHRSNGIVYLVGTSIGLFSTDRLSGTTTRWYQEAPSAIGNMVVHMIDVRQSDGYVAVATHGAGVWTTTIDRASAETASAVETRLIASIAPNPVVGRSTISVNVPAGQSNRNVRVRLFDPRGALVATLHDRPLAAGMHPIVLSPGDAGIDAGRYFCRVEVGSRVETGSITVLAQ
jgi:hypothetical protein